jgi:hypothetical protein
MGCLESLLNQLMGSNDLIYVVFMQKLLSYVVAEEETRASAAGSEPSLF